MNHQAECCIAQDSINQRQELFSVSYFSSSFASKNVKVEPFHLTVGWTKQDT